MITILWKQVLKQAFGRVEKKSEITAIPNKYKNTLDDLIPSSVTESQDRTNSPDRPETINKRLCNPSRSRGGSPTLLEKDCLDKNVPVTSLEPTPKIRALQVHQRYDIAPFDSRSGRAQYENGQRGGKDRKGKRDRKNGKGEKDRESHRGNKIDPVLNKSSGFETSDYYHIIY